MIRKTLLLALGLALGLLVTACTSSPPNHYYKLSAHDLAPPTGTTPSIGVGPINVPEYLSRENLVLNSLDNSLQVSAVDLWAEPLDNGIQRVLVLNLAALQQTQNVQFFPWHLKRAPDYGVKVNVLELDASPAEAVLVAEWLVYRTADSGAVKQQITRLQVPLASGTPVAEQIAQAYSKLLYQLSEIIANAIATDPAKSQRVADQN